MRLLNRCFKWLLTSIVALVSLALLVMLAATLTLYIAHRTGKLHGWINKAVGAQISYQSARIHWRSWHPSITLNQVKVNTDAAHTNMQVNSMSIQIDIWSSVRHLLPVANNISIDGLTINIKPTKHGAQITSIQSNVSHNLLAWRVFAPWLKAQRNIHLENTKLIINRNHLPAITFSGLDILWQRVAVKHYHLAISSQVNAAKKGQGNLRADIKGNIGQTDGFAAKLYLQLRSDDIASLAATLTHKQLQIDQGKGQMQLWATYDNGRWQHLQSSIQLQQTVLSSTKLAKQIKLDTVGANLTWQQLPNDNWRFTINKLKLANDWLHASFNGTVDLDTKQPSQSQVDLTANYSMTQAKQKLPLILPKQIGLEHLRQWLKTAITKQPELTGNLSWHGQLAQFPYADHSGKFALTLTANHTDLRPTTDWPLIHDVNLAININGPKLLVDAQGGHSQGVKLQAAQVKIANIWHATAMLIHLQAQAAGPQAQQYLNHTPLKQHFFAFNQNVKLLGPLKVDLTVHQPLLATEQFAHHVAGHIELDGVSGKLALSGLSIKQARGIINIDDGVLTSSGIKAMFLGHRLDISIDHAADANNTQVARASGVLDSQTVDPVWPALEPFIQGQTAFTYRLSWGGPKVTGRLITDLKGVAIHLPAPFAKSQDSSMPSSFGMDFTNPKKLQAQFHLGHIIAGSLSFNSLQQLERGAVKLGSGQAPALPAEQNFNISGQVPYVNINTWQKMISASKHQSAVPADSTWLDRMQVKVNLSVAEVALLDHYFSDITINAEQTDNKRWQINLASQALEGDLQLPGPGNNSIDGQFNYIHLPAMQLTEGGNKSQGGSIRAKQLAAIPPINITAKQFTLGNSNLGNLTWHSRPTKDGAILDQLKLQDGELNANLQLALHQHDKAQDQVAVKGHVHADNWGKTLTSVGFAHLITGGAGEVDADLTWLGLATKPNLPTLAGKVSFDLKDGALSSVRPGAARLLGLFNLQSLFRRLTLNLADTEATGLEFDTLQGKYHIENSIARTKAIHLSGPSLNLILRGDIDLGNKTLNQNVVVIPQVAGPMALAVGIIGGPIAGAATWVADKLLTSTVLKDRGLVFHITGPWQKPKVEADS